MSANMTANKDFYTQRTDRKIKKGAKQYKTSILQQQFKNKNSSTLTNVCQIQILQFVTLLLHK